jgi:type I restriction enzyme S subunit
VKKGDIAYNSMRMWQGASGYSRYDGIVSPAYTVISPKDNINAKFISYAFKKTEMLQIFQRNSQGLTSDTWNLKFPALSTINLMIPKYNEQIKVSILFEKLDHLITLHQRKLDVSKEKKHIYRKCLYSGNMFTIIH